MSTTMRFSWSDALAVQVPARLRWLISMNRAIAMAKVWLASDRSSGYVRGPRGDYLEQAPMAREMHRL
ncbi:MAG: hypothetical protein P4L86_18820 [Mycobacterium sp.]|nr:hypothetical protein [Mycobacterium sp.]